MGDINKISWPGWEVTGIIGRGGFGNVYKIRREVVDEEEFAALKVISIPKDESEVEDLFIEGMDKESVTQTFRDQVKDIVREYKIMKQMRDVPNIVHCDDVRCVQKDDGYGWDIYIQMELLTPLKKCLDRVTSTEEILRLGIDLCKALVACQEQSIIHRDIKPENVFVSATGKYKLGDFGIARSVEHTTVMTMAGTYPFMAPEVTTGKYDRTVDIYSLGLVLYWLLNERRGPFVPVKPTYNQKREAQDRRFAGEPLPAPKHGSEALKAVVLKACAFDPKDRYQSAHEMLADLNALTGNAAPVQKEPEKKLEIVTEEPEPNVTVVSREDATVVEKGPAKASTGPVEKPDPVEATVADRKYDIPPKKTEEKPKKKRTPALIAAILAVVLVIGGAAGVMIGRNAASMQDHPEDNLAADAPEEPQVDTSEADVPVSEIKDFIQNFSNSEKDAPVIAFVPKVVGQAWWDFAKTGVEAWEAEAGIDVIYEGSSAVDVDAQIQIMTELINQDIDILCVSPNDPAACEEICKQAREKGIIVIATEAVTMKNVDFDVEAFNDDGLGDFLMDQLAAQMGYEGQYITMVGSMTMASHNNWADAAVAHQQQAYPNMELVPDARVSSEFVSEVAYNLTKELLQKYPNLKGILGTSSFDAPGAARAIEELGLTGEVFAISVAMPSETRDYLKAGVLQAVGLWDPAATAQAMLNLGVAMYYGADITDGMSLGITGYEEVYVTGNLIVGKAYLAITKENVDKFTF